MIRDTAKHREQHGQTHNGSTDDMDREYPQQRRYRKVECQIWNYRPVRHVKSREYRVGWKRCQYEQPRQVVRVIQQRRHISERQRGEQREA